MIVNWSFLIVSIVSLPENCHPSPSPNNRVLLVLS